MDPNWLTGYEEHLASLPDDSVWDGYDRGDLNYHDDLMPPWCEPGAEAFGLNLATVAGHIAWERTARPTISARAEARKNYLTGLIDGSIWF